VTEVVLCESAEEVTRSLSAGVNAGRLFIALTPAAASALRTAGISYQRPEDFAHEDELCRGAEARLERLARWADWLDARLHDKVPELRDAGFAPARVYFFFLNWLANAVFLRGHALDRVAAAVAPSRVVWGGPSPRDEPIGLDLGYLTSRASLWPPMIEAWACARDLQRDPFLVPRVNPAAPPEGRAGWIRRIRDAVHRDGLPTCLRYAAARAAARARLAPPTTAGAVVFLQDNYDLPMIRAELRRRGQACASWAELSVPAGSVPRDLETRLSKLWGELETESDLTAPFVVDDVDFGGVVQPRLRRFCVDVVAEMYRHFLAARALFARARPRAVMAPYAEAAWQGSTLEAARSLGVPTVLHQHGGFPGACELPIWRQTDRYVPDYFFVYGDGVRAWLDEDDHHRGTVRARTVVVGSARLDAVRRPRRRAAIDALRGAARVADRARPVVLYVPYMFRGNLRYLSCDDYPDVSFYELQVAILELFRGRPDVHFVYKAFSDAVANPLLDVARALPNVSVIGPTEIRVTRLMWAADAIVLDIPSTALLECLVTPKPLVTFADRRSLRMRPEAKELLRRRASLAETPDEFLAEIRRLLDERRLEDIRDPDDGFLRAYGTYRGDGRSAERAAAAVLALATGRTQEEAS